MCTRECPNRCDGPTYHGACGIVFLWAAIVQAGDVIDVRLAIGVHRGTGEKLILFLLREATVELTPDQARLYAARLVEDPLPEYSVATHALIALLRKAASLSDSLRPRHYH